MAHFICCYSGLEIKTNHFPMYLSQREPHLCCHPIFHASQKSLLSYARKWSARELTPEDNYLLYVALLRSTDLVYFRAPAKYIVTELIESEYGDYSGLGSASIIAANMEKLMIAICRINSLSSTRVKFPEVVITEETCSLWNSKHWINNWIQVWVDYHDGVSRQEKLAKLSERELALQRMIRSPHRNLSTYARDLAEWADEVCAFNQFIITTPDGRKIPYNEYYMEIIELCAARDFFKINKTDLEDVIDTIHERMEFGSIQSHLLLDILRGAQAYLNAMMVQDSARSVVKRLKPGQTFNFPDVGLPSAVVEEEFNALTEHQQKIVNEAPLVAPIRGDFVRHADYIKAKIKFDAAQNLRAGIAAEF